MIYFTFNISNPFAEYKEQEVAWRLIKDNNPFSNITLYKNIDNLLSLSFSITLKSGYVEIGFLGYSLLLDKS
jgi:hypothetical protein